MTSYHCHNLWQKSVNKAFLLCFCNIIVCWKFVFAGQAMYETRACFNLPVFFDCSLEDKYGNCTVGGDFYDLDGMSDNVNVQLTCSNKNEYIKIIYAEFAMPALFEDYCLDKNSFCSKTEPCSCCTEPVKYTDLCYIAATLSKPSIEHCQRNGSVCVLNFKRTKFRMYDCPDLEYSCETGNSGTSWCTSRWVIVYYECVFVAPLVTTSTNVDQQLTTTTLPLTVGTQVNSDDQITQQLNVKEPRINIQPGNDGGNNSAVIDEKPSTSKTKNVLSLSARIQSSGWVIGMLIVITFVIGTALIICITIIVFFVREMAASLGAKTTTTTTTTTANTNNTRIENGHNYNDIYYREITAI